MLLASMADGEVPSSATSHFTFMKSLKSQKYLVFFMNGYCSL